MLPVSRNKRVSFNDLQMYVAIGVKHIRLILLVTCLGVLTGGLYYEYAIPVYYSRGLIEFTGTPRPMTVESHYGDTNFGAVVTGMQSTHVVERAASKLGIDMRAKYFLRQHLKKMKFERNSQGNAEVDMFGTSYALVRDWLPTLLDAYLEIRDEARLRNHEQKIQSYTREIVAMGERADEFRDKMERLEVELKVYETNREWSSLQTLPTRLQSTVEQLAAIEEIKQQAQNESLSTVAKLAFLSKLGVERGLTVGDILTIDSASRPVVGTPALANAGNVLPAPAAPGGPAAESPTQIVVLPSTINSRPSLEWESVDRRRQEAEKNREELLKVYLPAHRSVKEAEAELSRLTGLLQNELEGALGRLELEHQRLMMKKRDLEGQLPTYREVSRRLTQINREIAQFNTSRMNWEQSAESMSKDLAVLDFVSDREGAEVVFRGLMQINDSPISPPRGKLALASIALGFGMAIGLVVLIEYLDNTVTVQDQVQDELGLLGLGVIPKFAGNSDPRIPLTGQDPGRHYSLLETFRVVRTNLLTNKEQSAARRQVIMVTSSIPREGKSMVSSNLAATFAGLHEKTLLIDADIRRGKVHRSLGERSSPGLSDILRGTATMEESLRQTGVENLWALPCGERVQNVPAVLISPQFAELLTELRKQFTRIIVDTPPVLGLSETCGMLPLMDGVVMVVWCGYTPLTQVKTAVDLLKGNGANFYGCILNRLDLNDAVNYQHYYYYSNYYYQAYRPDQLPEELEQALRENAVGAGDPPAVEVKSREVGPTEGKS